MKKRIPSFLAGMLTMALICALIIPVLASAGMTITVDPINIQVNGTTFQPKDANGKDVPVFAYNGSTYAPLRALANAYGLEVGYDTEKNMATVGKKGTITAPTTPPVSFNEPPSSDDLSYDEFKNLFSLEYIGEMTRPYEEDVNERTYFHYQAFYIGNMNKDDFLKYYDVKESNTGKNYPAQWVKELFVTQGIQGKDVLLQVCYKKPDYMTEYYQAPDYTWARTRDGINVDTRVYR